MPRIERRSLHLRVLRPHWRRPTQLFLLMLRHLNLDRFRPVVLCPSPGELSSWLQGHGVRTLFLEAPKLKTLRVWRLPAYIWRLARIVRQEDAALTHCDTLPLAVLSGFAARLAGCRRCFMPASQTAAASWTGWRLRSAPASSPCPKPQPRDSAVCQPWPGKVGL